MKKGLLLSVVASTMIFAGGDIAPVEPAAPASADFWGQIGFAYQFESDKIGGFDVNLLPPFHVPGSKTGLGKKQNNAFSTAVVLGVEKQLAYGFGFGAEVAGWTDFGLDIADNARVAGGDQTNAEVSQAYLTYSFGNTAIKAGRQALPKAVSPWAWSDRTAGVIDNSFDAIVIANTDIQDTTLVGAFVANRVTNNSPLHIGNGKIDGLYMLSMINKSLANTTLTLTGYYVPKFFGPKAAWSIWGSALTSFDTVKAGLQVAYVGGNINGAKDTFGVAGKVGSSWGDFDATLIAGYINKGDYTLNLGGTSAFWTDNEMAGDISPFQQRQWAILLKAGYKLPVGKIYGSLGYWDYAHNSNSFAADYDKAWGARLGYKFTVAGVNAKVEYRYRDISYNNGLLISNKGNDKRQRIRVEAYYKF